MRLSTAGMHRSSIDAILEHQVKLSKTQNQVTTGKKFQTASEDPIGAARAAGLERKLADNAQYGRNSNIIQSRLSYEEQTLADITSVLQSARDSALAGANATLGQSERKMIANQVRQNLAALMDMANRQDGNGEYLFAGTSTATRPFAQGASRRHLPGRPDDAADPHQQHAIADRCACRRGRLHGHRRAQRRVPHDGVGGQHRQCDHQRGHGDGPHRLGAR